MVVVNPLGWICSVPVDCRLPLAPKVKPLPSIKMLPDPVDTKAWFTVTLPPYTVKPPAIELALLSVTPAVLPDLPSCRPPRDDPNTKPPVRIAEVLNAVEKLVPTDSTTSEPGPLKALLPVVGVSFCSTSTVPVSISVVPV